MTNYSYSDSIAALCDRGLDRRHVTDGSIPEASLRYLMHAAVARLAAGPARVLHVGNFVGLSLCYITDAVRRHDRGSIVVAIDPNLVHRNIPRPQHHVVFLLARYGLLSNSVLLTGYSLEKCISNDGVNLGYDPYANSANEHAPANQLPHLAALCGRVFDLVIIDGNHDPEYLKREISVIDRLLKPGGMLAIDDINAGWPALQKVVQTYDQKKFIDLGTDGRIALLAKFAEAR
jgi:predicted O-methyltransferase YrrM